MYSSSQGCHTATETHVPYGITVWHGRGDIPALTPAEAGTRSSDPGGMQGWVGLVLCEQSGRRTRATAATSLSTAARKWSRSWTRSTVASRGSCVHQARRAATAQSRARSTATCAAAGPAANTSASGSATSTTPAASTFTPTTCALSTPATRRAVSWTTVGHAESFSI